MFSAFVASDETLPSPKFPASDEEIVAKPVAGVQDAARVSDESDSEEANKSGSHTLTHTQKKEKNFQGNKHKTSIKFKIKIERE